MKRTALLPNSRTVASRSDSACASSVDRIGSPSRRLSNTSTLLPRISSAPISLSVSASPRLQLMTGGSRPVATMPASFARVVAPAPKTGLEMLHAGAKPRLGRSAAVISKAMAAALSRSLTKGNSAR
jgi:hypothetical protein